MFVQLYEEKFMRFPQGRSKAVTFSYDDGGEADKRLVAVFDKYGLKGTFNLNTELFDAQCWHNRMNERDTFNLFCKSNHEIANHGARHIFLDKVPLAEAVKEIVDCRAYLEGKFKRLVTGLAYSYSGYNEGVLSVLPSLGIDYARTTQSSYSFALPENWYLWNPTCKHSEKELVRLADKFLNDSPEKAAKHRGPWLFYIWGHSFEFDESDDWNIIESLGERLCGRQDIWFATNGEIYSYVKAYNSLVYSIDGERVHNPSALDVWVELRGKVYKIGAGKTVNFDKVKRF